MTVAREKGEGDLAFRASLVAAPSPGLRLLPEMECRFCPVYHRLMVMGTIPRMWPLSSQECYVSIDIEADGPVPGLHSMLSLGAAAFTSDGVLGDTFSVNLEQLHEASEDVRTMRWWASQSAAWQACRTAPEAPGQAMRRFHAWLERQHAAVGLPVMVAFPAAYDAMWVQWYLHRFVGDDPFRRRAIDVKTLAMVATEAGYGATTKSRLPKHWRPAGPAHSRRTRRCGRAGRALHEHWCASSTCSVGMWSSLRRATRRRGSIAASGARRDCTDAPKVRTMRGKSDS